MTARQGSLWKTSWKKDKGTVPPAVLGQMAFFNNLTSLAGQAEYHSAALSLLGTTLPFWVGLVCKSPNGGFFRVAGSRVGAAADVISATSIGGAGTLSGGIPTISQYDEATDVADEVSAIICLFQTTKDADGINQRRVSIYFNNQIYVTNADAQAFVAPADILRFTGQKIHGACGGPGVPTQAQMSAWFTALKTNLKIGVIPGMTTHIYSASVVYPLVPAVLPNGGTAVQDLNYAVLAGAPTPTNVLEDVRFNW